MKKLLGGVLFLATIWVGYTVMLGFNEEEMIFFPVKEHLATPENYSLNYEDVHLVTRDNVRLHGWFFPNHLARKTLLFFHGNAGNISGRLEIIYEFIKKLDVSVFIVDYRGFGLSEGKPSEEGIYEDAQTAYRFLIEEKEIESHNIVVYGRSLGGVPAVDLAYKKPAYSLILENTFTKALDMAKRLFPYLPVGLVMKTKFESESKIKNITIPKLIIHARLDETVPFGFGQRLFEAAQDPKQFFSIPTANHVNAYLVGGDSYYEKIKEFI